MSGDLGAYLRPFSLVPDPKAVATLSVIGFGYCSTHTHTHTHTHTKKTHPRTNLETTLRAPRAAGKRTQEEGLTQNEKTRK